MTYEMAMSIKKLKTNHIAKTDVAYCCCFCYWALANLLSNQFLFVLYSLNEYPEFFEEMNAKYELTYTNRVYSSLSLLGRE